MKQEIAQKIINLNHQFYQSFAQDFSETRGRLQPGVMRILEDLPEVRSVLDLGCGNGKIALQLAERGFQGSYLGADFSLGLIDRALEDIPSGFQAEFIELDLTKNKWDGILPDQKFDAVFCFATLHHIPSSPLRLSVCQNIRKYIHENGTFSLSVWQFLRSERLRSRILPWDSIGLKDEDVDQGDYLLDWRRGGFGTRYAHLYTPEELIQLAGTSRFRMINTFDSDGEGGNLGLYQTWEPA